MIQKIDITPSWEGLLPAMLAVYIEGDIVARGLVREEFWRMARAADVGVALVKKQEAENAQN